MCDVIFFDILSNPEIFQYDVNTVTSSLVTFVTGYCVPHLGVYNCPRSPFSRYWRGKNDDFKLTYFLDSPFEMCCTLSTKIPVIVQSKNILCQGLELKQTFSHCFLSLIYVNVSNN